MIDPVANLSGLVGMLLDIVGTTLTAIFLPTISLIVTPLLALLQLFGF